MSMPVGLVLPRTGRGLRRGEASGLPENGWRHVAVAMSLDPYRDHLRAGRRCSSSLGSAEALNPNALTRRRDLIEVSEIA
jgi:hypothetical protein